MITLHMRADDGVLEWLVRPDAVVSIARRPTEQWTHVHLVTGRSAFGAIGGTLVRETPQEIARMLAYAGSRGG